MEIIAPEFGEADSRGVAGEVLLLLARTMQQSLRNNDMPFRFGGEEFVVALEHTDESGAELALERRCRVLLRAPEPPRMQGLVKGI